MGRVRLGILVGTRGRGSNMAALAVACGDGSIPAEVAVVVSPVADSPAAQAALELGLRLVVVSPDSPHFGADLREVFVRSGCDFICLAGFMKLLPREVLHEFSHRVVNIHPSLLPKFGGKGMYGMNVHRAVLAEGEELSGCTVHLVNEVYDDGEIVYQESCPVLDSDTPETLASRVLSLEHQAYPKAMKQLIETYGSRTPQAE